MPKKTEIDFDRVMVWLEAGWPLKEIAIFFDCGPNTVGRWARRELTGEKRKRYLYLVHRNNRAKPVQCGTTRGYHSHAHYKTPACQPCLDAFAEDQRKRARKAGRKTLSEEMYRRHREGIIGNVWEKVQAKEWPIGDGPRPCGGDRYCLTRTNGRASRDHKPCREWKNGQGNAGAEQAGPQQADEEAPAPDVQLLEAQGRAGSGQDG